jgi:SNF2 family DNA or RNA helicase
MDSVISSFMSDLITQVEDAQPPMDRYENWLKTAGLDSKKHQIQGMDFCLSREATSKPYGVKGGIIADEMGLGKTILTLGCMMVNRTRNPKRAGNLIVLPPALLSQWIKLVKKFTGIKPLVFHGLRVKRTTDEQLDNAPIVITTYGMIAGRKKGTGRRLWKFKWTRLIMDEAHHIRNMKTGAFIGAMKLKADVKWLVSGTPIQNSYSDFYALCSVLGLKSAFYADPNNVKKIVNHHVLRRTKEQVGIQLPPLEDEYIEVPWASKAEEKLAQHIHSMASFANVDVPNFPHLVTKAVRRLRKAGVIPKQDIANVKTTSKATAVVNHLMSRIDNNRRKIVFCHYRGEIDLIAALLEQKGVKVGKMDGRTGKKDRAKILEFKDNESMPSIIVVQIQTACEGLNLQHFQEIYFTSPHWNPAIEDQAIARAHRIGQNEKVNVFRFVMADFNMCTCGDSECKTEAGITIDTYCKQVQLKKRELTEILDKQYKDVSPEMLKKLSSMEEQARNQQKRLTALMKKFEKNQKKKTLKIRKKKTLKIKKITFKKGSKTKN